MRTSKKLLAAMLSGALLSTATPAVATAENIEIVAQGVERRSALFDNFFKCMLHKSTFSNFSAKRVSLRCYKQGNSWYYKWWN